MLIETEITIYDCLYVFFIIDNLQMMVTGCIRVEYVWQIWYRSSQYYNLFFHSSESFPCAMMVLNIIV